MSFNSTNPVVVGQRPRKSHYDRIFDNCLDLNSRMNYDHNAGTGAHDQMTRREVVVSGGNYTISPTTQENVILIKPSSASRTVTLPLLSSVPAGREYTIGWHPQDATQVTGGRVVVAASGADTLDGYGTSMTIGLNGYVTTFMADADRWLVTNEYVPAAFSWDGKLAVQTLTTGVVTNVTWTSPIDNETLQGWGGTGSLTLYQKGLYDITATICFTSNATGYRQVSVFSAAKGNVGLCAIPTISGADVFVNVCAKAVLPLGDVINVNAFQNSGGNLDIKTAGTQVAVTLLKPIFD